MSTLFRLSLSVLVLLLSVMLPTESFCQLPSVVDFGLDTRFQDNFGPPISQYHQKRGRANICADFDNDGLLDVYLGNPRDESFVMRNRGLKDGIPQFTALPPLVVGELPWGAAGGDYDEDGDIDLFLSCGGNEGRGYDYLFQNQFMESGSLTFTDVTQAAGVAGPFVDGEVMATASANAIFVDYDCDGDLDLWVNTNDAATHQNILWSNQLRETGQPTFINVTEAAGLTLPQPVRTLHSSWSDFDHDGDMDLFENNFRAANRYWKNMLAETGNPTFVDNTSAASLPGDDLGYPINSFGSAAIDFNNDGYDDIIAVYRLRTPPGPEPTESPYGNGHAIFINDGTGRFSNMTNTFVKEFYPQIGGVMGFMVGDLNGDTFPEIYLGNGGPTTPQVDTFMVSDGTTTNGFPNYLDATHITDFPAPEHPKAPQGYYPAYPYRTHGTTFADTNNDGNLEILASNGGKAASRDEVREPNRHFFLTWPHTNHHLVVRLRGDGIHVNRDGVGARLKLDVSTQKGQIRSIYRAVRAGAAFSAQNDIRGIHFALGNATQIHRLEIVWADGTVQTVDTGLQINTKIEVNYQAP